jgi:hypothetical protein
MRSQYAALACMAFAVADCHLLPTFPQPLDLSSDTSIVASSWNNLTNLIDAIVRGDRADAKGDGLIDATNVTFSLGLFSLHDPAAATLQYHHAGPETLNSTIGTNSIDGDSIYQLASVSKLITAYSGMILLNVSSIYLHCSLSKASISSSKISSLTYTGIQLEPPHHRGHTTATDLCPARRLRYWFGILYSMG